MTDKEKAWAYDGALNRAKAAIDNAADKDLVKGVVTAIFPLLREGQENNVIDIPLGAHDSELKGWEYTIPEGFTAEIKDGKVLVREKESEDEKIRKELIEFIKWSIDRHFMREDFHQAKRPSEWIAYLEKHKESLHIPETCKENADSFTNEFEACMLRYLQSAANRKDDAMIMIDTKVYAAQLMEIAKKEQKPAEWHPTHEQMVALNWAANGIDNNSPCAGDIKASLRSLYNDLQSKSIKSAEWNEEDMEMLRRCVAAIQVQGDEILPTSYLNKLRNWLESIPERLNLQSKQEWSEEDITNGWTGVNLERYLSCLQRLGTGNPQQPETINSKWFKEHCSPQPREEIYQSAKHNLAIRFMHYINENRPEGKMSLSNGECEDIDRAFKENNWARIMRYVKKYRPSWKPSEEQIKALQMVKDSHCFMYQKDRVAIEKLLEQIKSL